MHSAERRPKVFIVILNWNNWPETVLCLASLADLTFNSIEILVVDNGSTDASVKEIQTRFPRVSCLVNEENLGFGRGNNVGLKAALQKGADYILLLNNDTEVAPDLIERLLEAFTQPEVGLVGPRILYKDPPDMIWSEGGS